MPRIKTLPLSAAGSLMNGVTIKAEQSLEFVQEADAVLIGSGTESLVISQDLALLAQLPLNPAKTIDWFAMFRSINTSKAWTSPWDSCMC